MTEQEALAILDKVDATTTKMGVAVGKEADTLQAISDEIDAIVKAGNLPDTVAGRLTAFADSLQGVSDNLDTHEAILTAILAKGQPPVPVTPVPEPTPVP